MKECELSIQLTSSFLSRFQFLCRLLPTSVTLNYIVTIRCELFNRRLCVRLKAVSETVGHIGHQFRWVTVTLVIKDGCCIGWKYVFNCIHSSAHHSRGEFLPLDGTANGQVQLAVNKQIYFVCTNTDTNCPSGTRHSDTVTVQCIFCRQIADRQWTDGQTHKLISVLLSLQKFSMISQGSCELFAKSAVQQITVRHWIRPTVSVGLAVC